MFKKSAFFFSLWHQKVISRICSGRQPLTLGKMVVLKTQETWDRATIHSPLRYLADAKLWEAGLYSPWILRLEIAKHRAK
jgi:hypothetical protein